MVMHVVLSDDENASLIFFSDPSIFSGSLLFFETASTILRIHTVCTGGKKWDNIAITIRSCMDGCTITSKSDFFEKSPPSNYTFLRNLAHCVVYGMNSKFALELGPLISTETLQ